MWVQGGAELAGGFRRGAGIGTPIYQDEVSGDALCSSTYRSFGCVRVQSAIARTLKILNADAGGLPGHPDKTYRELAASYS
jgi:hypothetical protein